MCTAHRRILHALDAHTRCAGLKDGATCCVQHDRVKARRGWPLPWQRPLTRRSSGYNPQRCSAA
eukprot:351626-Chlamydomonas_euryale.AAC.3